MIVATAGHIDHGKTTLVKALTGVDTDRLPQEQARGNEVPRRLDPGTSTFQASTIHGT
jgi:translation initiation factor 2 gamma subunit (eIF-2gamma)